MRADDLGSREGGGTPDATAMGKQHFEVLDGLRGTAALLVVLFHIQGITVGFLGDKVVLHHAPLAVDFFFALSGFVIGYAYDDRWPRMTVRHFLALRLIRLHPLAVLGVTLGLASYLLDPFAGAAQVAPARAVLTAFALGLLLLPSPPLPNRWEDTHPLDGPCWTLLQEYIGNIAYALALRRLSARMLGLVAVVAGVALVASGLALGTLDRGWGWDKLWMAPVRLAFPFVAGLWLYRVRHHMPRLRLGLLPLSLALVVAFAMPTLPDALGIRWNGLYEAACVVLLFPAIVLLGAHSDAGAGMIGLCKASGRISYPLYITHFPFAYVWMNYVATAHPSTGASWVIGTALLAFVLLVAWAAFTLYDVPIRARLRRRIGA